MSRIKYAILGTTAAAAAYVGALMYGSSTGSVEKHNLPFQGHTRDGANSNVTRLVFDEHPLMQREGRAPEVKGTGNPEGLEMGKRYDIEVDKPKWDWTRPPSVTVLDRE